MERVRTGFEYSNFIGASGANMASPTGNLKQMFDGSLDGIKRFGIDFISMFNVAPVRRINAGANFVGNAFVRASTFGLSGGYGDFDCAGIYGNLLGNSSVVFDPVEYPNGLSLSYRFVSTSFASNGPVFIDFKVSGDFYSISSTRFGQEGRLKLYKNGVLDAGAGDVAFAGVANTEFQVKITIGMSAGTQNVAIDIDNGFTVKNFDIGATIAGNLEEEIFLCAGGTTSKIDDLSVNDDRVRLTFDGDGDGAEGYATLTGGGDINTVVITKGGFGYTSPPTVVFLGTALSNRTLTAVLTSNAVTSVTIGGSADAGLVGDNTGIPDLIRGYNLAKVSKESAINPSGNSWIKTGIDQSQPTPADQLIDNQEPSTAGSTADDVFAGYALKGKKIGQLLDGGVIVVGTLQGTLSGYQSGGEAVTLSGGSGSGATATVVIDGGGNITSITITGGGTNYEYDDELTITGDTSSTATARLFIGVIPAAVDNTAIIHAINIYVNGYRQPIAGKKLITQIHTDTADVIAETGGANADTNSDVLQDGPLTINAKNSAFFAKPDGTRYDPDDLDDSVSDNNLICGIKVIA